MVELIEIYLFHGICRSYLSTSIPLMSLCALLVQPFWFARGLQVQWTVTSDSALNYVIKFCKKIFRSRDMYFQHRETRETVCHVRKKSIEVR